MPKSKRKTKALTLHDQVEQKRKKSTDRHEEDSSSQGEIEPVAAQVVSAESSLPIADDVVSPSTSSVAPSFPAVPGMYGGMYDLATDGIPRVACLDPLTINPMHDIDMFIPQQLKEKIWDGKFVDLACLLKSNFYSTSTEEQEVKIINNNLMIQNKKKKSQISDKSQWTDAFLNFVQIYIQKHPAKAGELLKYLAIIREIGLSNPIQKWLRYDGQFRLRMSVCPERSWAAIDGHLWLVCNLNGENNQSRQYGKMPAGHCFDFNLKGFCAKSNCLYKHSCMNCSGSHPRYLCFSNVTPPVFGYQNPRMPQSQSFNEGGNIRSHYPNGRHYSQPRRPRFNTFSPQRNNFRFQK